MVCLLNRLAHLFYPSRVGPKHHRRRPPSWKPQGESLEERRLLATMAMGMNLSWVADYNPAWMFTDAFKESRPWLSFAYNTITGSVSPDQTPAAIDLRGWPTQLAQWTNEQGQLIQQRLGTGMFDGFDGHYPSGVYYAQWDGAGDIVWGGDAIVTEQGTADGHHYAKLTVTAPTRAGISMRIDTMTDPIRNVHVWMPDYNGQSFVGQVWYPGASFSPFHPLFLERLAPFKTLRYVHLQLTNSSDIVHWTDSKPWDYARQMDSATTFQNGMSPEYLIELANELDADPWFNMPYLAQDDYVRTFAQQVLRDLDPGLKAYVEWSDELWNPSPEYQGHQWLNQELTKPENAGLTFYQLWAREVETDFAAWSDVFAGQSDRLVRVVSGQAANSWVVNQVLPEMHGDFDAVSCAGYVEFARPQLDQFDESTTPDQIIDAWFSQCLPNTLAFLQNHKDLADQYSAQLGRNIPMLAYEGGPIAYFYGLPFDGAFREAAHSPRLYDLYRSLLRGANQIGVDLFVAYVYTEAARGGDSAALYWQDQPVSEAHKYRALLDAASGELFRPEFSISVVTVMADEHGQHPATVSITRTGDASAPVNLSYQLSGSANTGDIVPLPATISFAADEVTKVVSITPIDDMLAEGDEQLTIMLTAGAGYTIDTAHALATITIRDDDVIKVVDLPIQNPSFETGNLSGWTLQPASGNFSTVSNAVTDPNAPSTAHQGQYLVWGGGVTGGTGGGANPAGVSQRINLSSYAADIDGGQATLTFTGWGAGSGTGQQWAFLEVRFFDAASSGNQLSATITSNLATALKSWTQMTATGAVPAGTRGVEVRAMTQRPSGYFSNRAGFDDFAAQLVYPLAQIPLQVNSFTPAATGFVAQFNQDLDPSMLNLYDQGGLLGAADVVLTGSTTGPVRGSLVVDPGLRKITFIKTGGLLAADTYTATLRGTSDGFRDSQGNALDGNFDGLAGGDAVSSFTIAPLANGTVSVGIADFARGYSQAVNVPAAVSSGIPITISSGQGVGSVSLRLLYNPALLSIASAALGPGVTGATLQADLSTPGAAVLTVTSTSDLSSTQGPLTLVNLTAQVPFDATYGFEQLLDITDLVVLASDAGHTALPSADDDGIHIVAFVGDANGSRSYNAPDATLVQRVIVGVNSGFSAYPLTDPIVIADVSANGAIQSNDVTLIQRAIVGMSQSQIPPLPAPSAASSAAFAEMAVLAAPPLSPSPAVDDELALAVTLAQQPSATEQNRVQTALAAPFSFTSLVRFAIPNDASESEPASVGIALRVMNPHAEREDYGIAIPCRLAPHAVDACLDQALSLCPF